ncbi:hypothetical protein [Flavisolibacter ginsengisoli]|jgi:arsenate reductase-like glutaredoxin family protein|uniref:DUF4468 domain-containing protein n=1 Tax=Flavisolibacter ginsengisoli DSM 18119 TaxID=1121884 RepID=A0A1M4SG92_9BACT|nr:hypothetical protein [Flavisolibacter ginsengisoli]SHE31168.1 hypothetical protein SAMN02745131_00105 [Flavisolibacter ginsengisoli DSM 18119]
MKVLSLYTIVFFIGMSASAQSGSIQLKVISGNKLLYIGEQGKLEEIFHDHFYIRKRELEDRITESIVESMKGRTSQGLRDLNIRFMNPIFSVFQVDSDVLVSITIPGNKVSYYITTPDYIGIGKDRSEDPFISFNYTIKGIFKISQQGEAESIEFQSPYWSYKVEENNSKKLQSLKWGKYLNDDIRGLVSTIKEQYKLLDEVKDKFNNYLDKKIIENISLQKELLVDENNKLYVSTEGDKTLVFKHDYSSAGILKRSAGTDASVINEKVNTHTTISTSTNPSDINKKTPNTNARPKLPNSPKPIDFKKGSSGTKKNTSLKL